jgi:hypothetical protein
MSIRTALMIYSPLLICDLISDNCRIPTKDLMVGLVKPQFTSRQNSLVWRRGQLRGKLQHQMYSSAPESSLQYNLSRAVGGVAGGRYDSSTIRIQS